MTSEILASLRTKHPSHTHTTVVLVYDPVHLSSGKRVQSFQSVYLSFDTICSCYNCRGTEVNKVSICDMSFPHVWISVA